MSLHRLYYVFDLEVRRQLRCPLILTMVALTGVVIWSLSTGKPCW